jgi:hypothetical protein
VRAKWIDQIRQLLNQRPLKNRTSQYADFYDFYTFHINYGQEKYLALADLRSTNEVEVCNYLYALGWELLTVSSNTSGYEGSTSTSNSYFFRRRTK